jgi:hypothetical protein
MPAQERAKTLQSRSNVRDCTGEQHIKHTQHLTSLDESLDPDRMDGNPPKPHSPCSRVNEHALAPRSIDEVDLLIRSPRFENKTRKSGACANVNPSLAFGRLNEK